MLRSLDLVLCIARFWPAPVQHLLISGCAVRPAAAASWDFVLDAAAPQLAFLRDHAVSGRLLLPGAALFEIALAAGRTLAGGGVHSRLPVAVTGAAIAAPVMLTPASAHVVLGCRVDLVAAAKMIVSIAGSARGQQPTKHFTARTASVETAVPLHSLRISQQHRQTVLTEVAAAANTAPSSRAAGARGIADMAFAEKLHGDGFVVHPAVVDCCMHVAASLNTPGSDGSPAPLRVPSSVEAYCALEEVKTGRTCASAALEGERLEKASFLRLPQCSQVQRQMLIVSIKLYDARRCCPGASPSIPRRLTVITSKLADSETTCCASRVHGRRRRAQQLSAGRLRWAASHGSHTPRGEGGAQTCCDTGSGTAAQLRSPVASV